jgi:hypothetical protein
MANESGGVNSSDSPESDISMIDINNNYETKSTKTGKESTDKKMTEETYGRGRGRGRGCGCGRGRPRGGVRGLQMKSKLV